MAENLGVESSGGVRTITFRRPQKKNAFTVAMYAEMARLLAEAAADPAVRVVVLTGEGTAFTAGNDLADFMGQLSMDDASPVFRFLDGLVDFEKPLIAAVNGPAVGVGTTLLLHCDLVYAAASARFHMPFVNLGLCPEAASTVLLPRLSGMARASELLLLGEPFGAEEARDAGLVCGVVPDAELAAHVKARAAMIASKPPLAIAATKRLLREGGRAELRGIIRREAEVFRTLLASPETAEAIGAFFRRPK